MNRLEVELLKDDDPIDGIENFDQDDTLGAFGAIRLAFDKGQANQAVVYVISKEEPVDIITISKSQADFQGYAARIAKDFAENE